MKITVKRRFRDKKSNKVFIKGKAYEGSEARIRELQRKGYLESGEPLKEVEPEGENPSLLDGTVEEVKKATADFTTEEFKQLIEEEGKGKNRSSLTEYFENMIATIEGE